MWRTEQTVKEDEWGKKQNKKDDKCLVNTSISWNSAEQKK